MHVIESARPVALRGIAVQPERSSGKFLNSIRSLLTVAAKESGADGFAFYEFEQAKGKFELCINHRLPAREPGNFRLKVTERPLKLAGPVSGQVLAIMTYPLQGEAGLAGLLDFGFLNPEGFALSHRQVLQYTADSIEAILRASGNASFLFHLIARIEALQAELADQKISERADGLLKHDASARKAHVLRDHVASVLNFREVEETLCGHLRALETRLEHRQAIASAKEVLQRRHGYSEEEAYLYLRETSRCTRTRLVEIAKQVIAGRSPLVHNRRRSAS